jgi:chromosome segregation ATPase
VELVVDERVTVRRGADWFSPIANSAMKAYLADPKSDRAVVQKLTAAWVVRNEIVANGDERSRLQQEYRTLSQATEETRRNLRAIEKNPSAEALRQKLTARLAVAATKLDELSRKVVELDAKLGELGVQFKEAIRDIKVTPPAAEF